MERYKGEITMSFSGAEFVSYINRNNGIAVGNRYKVEIEGGPEAPVPRDLDLVCHTAKIMGKTFEANAQTYGYGSEYNLPTHETFEDLSLSFHCTYGSGEDFRTTGIPEYRFFDKWMQEVIDPIKNETGWKDKYQKQIYITILDNKNKIKWKQKFVNAFPLSISDLELGSAGTELLTFDVTFTYDNWLANENI